MHVDHTPAQKIDTVGPAPIAHGSEAQLRRFLSAILASEIRFAIAPRGELEVEGRASRPSAAA
jgi:hypothetical protein